MKSALSRARASTLLRRLLSAALIGAAAVYVGTLVLGQWQPLVEAAKHISLNAFAAAVALLVVMGSMKAAYHVLALRRVVGDAGFAPADIALTYAVSQIVRYVPGKVFGIVYEANELANKVPPDKVVLANLVQMFHTSALSVVIFISVATGLFYSQLVLGLCALGAGTALIWLSHRAHLAERLATSLSRFLPRLQQRHSNGWSSQHFALTCSALLLLEWLPYFGYWGVLLPAGSNWLTEAILFGSCYAAAALIANLAVIMPSGLIVREALFLWLGTKLSMDAAHLLLLAAVSRALLLMADLLLVPLMWILRRATAAFRP